MTEGVVSERDTGAAVTRNPLRSHVVHSLLAPSLRVPHASLSRLPLGPPSLTRVAAEPGSLALGG